MARRTGGESRGEDEWRGRLEGSWRRESVERGLGDQLGGTRGHENLVKDAYRTLFNEVSRGSAVQNASDTSRSSVPSTTPFTG